MYPVSEAFLQAVQENTRRYYWTGRITTTKGVSYEFGADDIVKGMALVESSSGKHKGETTISRRGRKRLRYLLFEVAMSLVAKNSEFRELHNYYTTRRLNPLKKMQSLMAISAKLIRVFYAMLTKGVDYDPKKMVSDIKRPAVYLQAA